MVPVALSLGACGGSVRGVAGPDASATDGPAESSEDAGADSGTCQQDGSYPVECNGVLLYCCPPGAHCAPPSCGLPDAGGPAEAGDAMTARDTGACPQDQYLLVPCCGGVNDTSCSNGPGPPAPFCTAFPSSCEGESVCTIGSCEGPVDQTTGTLQCICI